jgi:hypothetical protein
MFVTFGTPSFNINKLLYKCEILSNRIVTGIEILILKSFGVVYVEFMVRKWYGILVIHR